MISPRVALMWSFASRYVAVALTLVTSMVLARLLTPAEIGKFSLCAAALAVAAVVRDFGISDYIIQEKELTEQKMRSAFAVALGIAWGIGLVVLALRHPIADFYKEPELVGLVSILALNFFLLPLATPAFALFNREMAFDKVFTVQVIAAAVQSGAGIGLAALGYGARALAWASVLGIFMQVVAITALRPRASLMLPSLRGAAGVVRYGVYAVSSRLLDSTAGNAHEFIIARTFGFASVGYFSRAKGLLDMGASNIGGAVNGVLMATLARANRAREDLRPVFARSTAIYSSFTFPFFGFLGLAAPEIVLLMFGSQWSESAPIARALAISAMPTALFSFCPVALNAMGQVKRRLHISAIFNPAHLVVLFVFATAFGLRAMAYAWLVTNLLLLVLYTWHLCRALGASVGDLYRPSWSSALVGGVAIAAMYGALEWARSLPSLAAGLTVALTVLAGASVWLLMVRALHHPSYDEVLRAWEALSLKVQGRFFSRTAPVTKPD